ncbi:MAG: GNAT family N-acetyltransferase [Ornithinimicrobium sp.]
MDELNARMTRAWALNAVAQATALAQADSSWGSETCPVADGWLVLSGPDMYVNRAMAVGIDEEVSGEDLGLIVSRCHVLGVQPEFEVTDLTLPGTVEQLKVHGFVADPDRQVTAMSRYVEGPDVDAPDDLVVRQVMCQADLSLWQEVSASGWGHLDARARAVSDAFTTAAYLTDRDGMMIAFEKNSERPVGCASVTIRDRLATLGGMSTHPDHRRRGVQAALVRHRLVLAAQRGCEYAVTTCATGGASERNLARYGFRPRFSIQTWTC